MSRKSRINWRESDAEKLNKTVKEFNAKINDVTRNNEHLAEFQPEKINAAEKKQLIDQFKNMPRSEFNKYINSMERYLQPGAERLKSNDQGVTVSKYEYKEIAYKVGELNRERTKARTAFENLEATSRGESLGMKRSEMGSERMNELKPKKFNFNKMRNATEWKKYKASLFKQTNYNTKNQRLESYKDNYIKGLENAFGDYAKDIIDLIRELPAETVVNTYYKEQEATIEFFYEPQAMQDKLNILYDIWQGVTDEQLDE